MAATTHTITETDIRTQNKLTVDGSYYYRWQTGTEDGDINWTFRWPPGVFVIHSFQTLGYGISTHGSLLGGRISLRRTSATDDVSYEGYIRLNKCDVTGDNEVLVDHYFEPSRYLQIVGGVDELNIRIEELDVAGTATMNARGRLHFGVVTPKMYP